jgi:crotonobetainyl-CoA:carnitine CoA-transferase CaiB-like acyl-CoA transferase
MSAPLSGIRVVAIDSWMASPSAGAILADMGAQVIKIEPLSGDPMRNLGRKPKIDDEAARGYDYQFDVDNRGKQSIAVALDQPEGVAVVHRLVASADIFMCNLLMHRQERFGLDPESVFKLKPNIVHATLTGYGTSGPDAWRPGYDVTAFFGRSGLYDAMREGEDGVVPMARPAQGDHTTGLAMVTGILGALRLAEQTGVGQAVETSLLATAVWTQATDYATTAVDAAPVRRRAREEMIIPTGNRYPCKDGKWVVFNMPDPNAWPKFCRVIGREDWLEDERLADVRGRFQNMAELVNGIDEALAEKTRDEWGEIFDAEGLIWGPVLGLHEVATDAQAQAIGLFPELEGPHGPYRSVSIPVRFASADVRPRGPSPAVGEHTRNVLTDIGLSAQELDELIEQGVIKG